MGRPTKILISKRKTAEAALKIIDEEGLDAVTIRRLGQELNVRGVSLYHHFKDKEAILAWACKLAFSDVRASISPDEDWRGWLCRVTLKYYETLLKHPNLVPAMLSNYSLRQFSLPERNMSAGILAMQGVPAGLVLPLTEALETLVTAFAGFHPAIDSEQMPEGWNEKYPFLYLLNKQRTTSPEELLPSILAAIIDSVVPRSQAATAGSD